MRKTFFITGVIFIFLTAYGYADMEEHMMGYGMMGGPGMEEDMPEEYMMYPGMMGPGMMGYGTNVPCMMNQGMMGYGMMGTGMMGRGMMMGPGMMGKGMMGYGMRPGMWGYNQKVYQKFLDDTKGLRRELHNKKFDYYEAMRNPDTKPEDADQLEKEIGELQKKIYEKMKSQ
ncbi:MAG: hypothetical protein C4538_13115 [Nitrospiraceae bacterium]|nr:MAG: hypothetical protein C4538_13115 [Nitrospiraceae bacterium]